MNKGEEESKMLEGEKRERRGIRIWDDKVLLTTASWA